MLVLSDTAKQQIGRPGSYFTNTIHHLSAQKGSVLLLKIKIMTIISIVQPCMHACIFQNKCGIYHRQKPIFAVLCVCLSISLPYFAQKMNGPFRITHTASAAWVSAHVTAESVNRIICSKSTQTTELFIAALFAQLIV